MISGEMTVNKSKPLALFAKSETDLNVISALVQDGVLKKNNIRWIKKRHRFSMLINRFRWELVPTQAQTTVPFCRVQTMLAFDGVLRVLSLGAENALEKQILSLLRIELIAGESCDEVKLFFSGNTLIRLKTEFIHVVLQDLDPINGLMKGTVPNHEVGIDH